MEILNFILTSFFTSGVAVAFFSWLFKDALERRLNLDLQREVERYKNELQLQSTSAVERLKAELQLQAQQQLEQLRSELNSRNDSIRHELQKQMLRAQLATTKTHAVYSDLIKMIRKAEGTVGGLWGGRFAPTFEKFGEDDIRRILQEAKAPGEEENEIVALWSTDRQKAVKLLEQVLRRKELHDAKAACLEAKNHVILEGIFMTQPVRDGALSVCTSLWEAWVQVDVASKTPAGSHEFYTKYEKLMEKAATEILGLEKAMRADLLPERT